MKVCISRRTKNLGKLRNEIPQSHYLKELLTGLECGISDLRIHKAEYDLREMFDNECYCRDTTRDLFTNTSRLGWGSN